MPPGSPPPRCGRRSLGFRRSDSCDCAVLTSAPSFDAFSRSGATHQQPGGGDHGQRGEHDDDDAIATGHRAPPVAVVGEPVVGVTALADSVDVVLGELVADAVGSGSKVTCIANTGPVQEPLPLLPPPEPLLGVWVELCSVTSLTPSIRRRRVSVSATIAWLVAQPASVKVGTLPAGVAEDTLELDAVAALELPAAGVVAPVAAAALLLAPAAVSAPAAVEPPLDPIVPVQRGQRDLPGGQHAAEFVEGVGPVEARVDELVDRLHALFVHRLEADVRREPGGLRLRRLRLRVERRDLAPSGWRSGGSPGRRAARRSRARRAGRARRTRCRRTCPR